VLPLFCCHRCLRFSPCTYKVIFEDSSFSEHYLIRLSSCLLLVKFSSSRSPSLRSSRYDSDLWHEPPEDWSGCPSLFLNTPSIFFTVGESIRMIPRVPFFYRRRRDDRLPSLFSLSATYVFFFLDGIFPPLLLLAHLSSLHRPVLGILPLCSVTSCALIGPELRPLSVACISPVLF